MRDLLKSHHITRVKALTDTDEPGTFEAIISVFGNTDADGDVVMPGAFTKTLAAGLKPLVYSHDWSAVPIGHTLEARETPEGLYVKGRLFVAQDEDHARAREVYAALRAGALTEFSWGGKVTSETRVEADDGDVTFELNEIDLVEYGPCLKGANPATRLLAVKSLVQADVMTREEARSALGVDTAKAEDPPPAAPPADPAGAAPQGATEPSGDVAEVPPADDGWSTTLAAHSAGVLTTAEARSRLGLPTLPDAADPVAPPPVEPLLPVVPPEPVASTSLERALAALRLHA